MKEFFVLFCLRLYVPVSIFSVILGQLPGFNHYAMGMKCLAQGHNTRVKDRTMKEKLIIHQITI